MKFPASLVALLAVTSACGPPDDKVSTADDAVRVAHERCQKSSAIGDWRAERVGDYWFARLGEADSQGQVRFTARIKAADGTPTCEVALPWVRSGQSAQRAD